MPTDKKKIMLYMEEVIKNKIEYIAKENDRSMSNYITQLIKKDIAKFELENGTIKTAEDSDNRK